jgi:hypothetical protein
MDHPVPLKNLSPQAMKVIDPAAPAQLKMMAASGVSAFAPAELVKVLYALGYEGDPGVSGKARETLGKLPDNVILSTLDQELEAGVFDGLARLLVKRDKAVERILLNRATPDEAVAWLTGQLKSERLLEIVVANEKRLLRFPQIIEALYLNARTRMSSVDRVMELAVRNGLTLTGIPTFAEIQSAILGTVAAEKPKPAAKPAVPVGGDQPVDDDLEFLSAQEDGDLEFLSVPEEDDLEFLSVLGDASLAALDGDKLDEVLAAMESDELSPEDLEEQERISKLEASLAKLSVSQKIRLATIGNSIQRAVLVRDSNKLVVLAVLKSPGVGDSDIIRFTKARSLPDEAVRYIAAKRDWTKLYQVKLNLVNNPRTPMQDALRFLNHLRPADVRALEASRDVPRALVTAAKQLRMKRQS